MGYGWDAETGPHQLLQRPNDPIMSLKTMLLLSGNGPFWQSEHAAAISVKNMGSRNTVQLVADDASSEIRIHPRAYALARRFPLTLSIGG